MVKPYLFQTAAAEQIAERVVEYFQEPIDIKARGQSRQIPFIQLLSSITASGKTIILADAVATLTKQLSVEPVVLWLSKATVVVEQTYVNLDGGGNLHELIDGFNVRLLSDFSIDEISDIHEPFLYFATVGTFNQRDKELGSRRIFASAIDDAARSTWDSLRLRPGRDGARRPLIIVYDEAHNLSDQQTDLLLELEPNAFILATATQRLSKRFNDEVVSVLKQLGGRSDADLTTIVDAREVAGTGLIKASVDLVGRQAPMEQVLDEMFDALTELQRDARLSGLEGNPKAVYVCKTNVVEGSDTKENPRQPFLQRQVPPILIWRYLTEKLGVDPDEIAVYCDLKSDKEFPLPEEFNLFPGGDKSYADFTSREFTHIIFNQSLQEGWDEPLLYLAYIDKSMGSTIQAEQIVGRLLRQPGRRHYASDRLNAAQIFVRVNSSGVFEEVVAAIQEKIRTGEYSIKLSKTAPGQKQREEFHPKGDKTVPVAAIVTDAAEEPILECISRMIDYRDHSGADTLGIGRIARIQKIVGEPGNERFVWEERGHSASVLARWLFTREVSRIYPGALGLALTSDGSGTATKFDARIGLGSNAATQIADVAAKVAEAFIDNVFLKLRRPNPYRVGTILQQRSEIEPFQNALHEGYDGLNPIESKCAGAIDRTGLTWCRNPSRVGYGIPLIEPGKTTNFYPDFLVWSDGNIFAIDTKGAHLHADAARKLVSIRPSDENSPRVFVRFITEGLVDEAGARKDESGFTVWSFKPNGKTDFTHCESIDDALKRCLRPDI
ncbi:hypothetical protein CN140_12470 [Sinorhizobium meliloti]|uniref:DEAD/DEAH box helicase family protein n=1 Tax=Rhizobium meliloti TaxID=382 RepID=UPI000FDAC98D|nr:DEAD/DEAH box helicase family protein [Sinorhizobium meliloti]RVL83945.1 hypothetical protein CN140_12470 [Sinorhizobium meliloti]